VDFCAQKKWMEEKKFASFNKNLPTASHTPVLYVLAVGGLGGGIHIGPVFTQGAPGNCDLPGVFCLFVLGSFFL
jgi:hypothetical protein